MTEDTRSLSQLAVEINRLHQVRKAEASSTWWLRGRSRKSHEYL
jgi:hypothetical protein